jgi:hypothetical protein
VPSITSPSPTKLPQPLLPLVLTATRPVPQTRPGSAADPFAFSNQTTTTTAATGANRYAPSDADQTRHRQCRISLFSPTKLPQPLLPLLLTSTRPVQQTRPGTASAVDHPAFSNQTTATTAATGANRYAPSATDQTRHRQCRRSLFSPTKLPQPLLPLVLTATRPVPQTRPGTASAADHPAFANQTTATTAATGANRYAPSATDQTRHRQCHRSLRSPTKPPQPLLPLVLTATSPVPQTRPGTASAADHFARQPNYRNYCCHWC